MANSDVELLTQYLVSISGRLDGSWFFRGHADSAWALVPSAGRRDALDDRAYDPAKEIDAFHNFRWQKSRHGVICENDLEALALGRHHGLPTRLLDWSANPLTAAFFASGSTGDLKKKDGIVHMIRTRQGTVKRSADADPRHPIDPFDPALGPEPLLVEVRPRHSRVAAQQGIFSLHPDPTKEFEPATSRLVIQYDSFVISGANKKGFERALSVLDFNSERLMADLDGLAQKLARDYARD